MGDRMRIYSIVILAVSCFVFFSCKTEKKTESKDFGYYLSLQADTNVSLFAPDIISTGHHEHSSVIISPDYSSAFYSLADNSQHIILELKNKNGKWSEPAVASFSGIYSDDNPFFSGDGKRLYFLSRRPVPIEDENIDWSVWYVEKSNGNWSDAKFDSVLTKMNILSPSMAKNGNLYFCSKERGGEGSYDLFLSKYENKKYSEPENLGIKINTKFMEAWMYIDPDEKYILFTAIGRPEGNGIYVSFKDENNKWKEAKFISEINKNGDERFVQVSPNKEHLFFNRQFSKFGKTSSKRLTIKEVNKRLISSQNGKGDVYWISSEILERYKH